MFLFRLCFLRYEDKQYHENREDERKYNEEDVLSYYDGRELEREVKRVTDRRNRATAKPLQRTIFRRVLVHLLGKPAPQKKNENAAEDVRGSHSLNIASGIPARLWFIACWKADSDKG